MTFLKPDQIDTTLLEQDTDPEPLQEFSLNAAIIDTIGVDQELQERIKETLPKDTEVAPYLDQIADPSLPRDEATQLYLEQYWQTSGPKFGPTRYPAYRSIHWARFRLR